MASLSRSKAAVWIARHLLPSGMVLVVLMLALGYMFIFRGQIASVRYADRVSALKDEASAKQAYLKKLDELKSRYDTFDPEDVTRLRQMIPREADVPGLLATLEAAAVQADLQLTAVNFAASDTSGLPSIPGLSAINVSVSLAHGDYGRFKLFLDGLQSSLRLFDVRSANINPSGASYTLTIRAYVWGKPS